METGVFVWQGIFPVRGGVGQLAAQLDAREPHHAVRRAHLHDHLRLPRGACVCVCVWGGDCVRALVCALHLPLQFLLQTNFFVR